MSISRFSSVLAFSLMTLAAACGSEGPQGEMGEMGDPGAPGGKGDKGDQGDMGDQGTPGTPGGAGSNGTNGTNGSNGTNGAACWDLNSNGTCDAATEDKNTDAACTPLDCQGAVGPQGPTGTGTAGQGAGSAFGNAALTLTPAATPTAVAIPNLSLNITVPAATVGNFVAFISTDGGIQCTTSVVTDICVANIILAIDGVATPNGGFQQLIGVNDVDGRGHWSFSITAPLAAGSHTIALFASTVPTTAGIVPVSVSGDGSSVHQGTLNAMLLKL